MNNMRERPIISNINTGSSSSMMNYGFLPDAVPVSNLMERIAADKKWSREDIDNDIAILSKNRIVYVHDLRALSRESWTQIELLPLVKDLLRSAVDPDWYTNEKSRYKNDSFSLHHDTSTLSTVFSSGDEVTEKKKQKKEKKKSFLEEMEGFQVLGQGEKEKKKDEKKKDKKKDKKKKTISQLGTPVIPTILNNSFSSSPTSILQPQNFLPLPNSTYNANNDTSSIASDTSLSQDHLTMQNTIRNGSISYHDGTSPLMPNAINTLSLSSSTSSVGTTTSNSSSGSNGSSSSDDGDEIMSPTTPTTSTTRRKSVTFSEETAIGVAASEKASAIKEEEEEKAARKREKKKEKKNKKNKENMASNNESGGFSSNFTSHPYTTHPIVKFRKMKMKHCKRLPEVPPNDLFLQGIHDKLILSQAEATAAEATPTPSCSTSMDTTEK